MIKITEPLFRRSLFFTVVAFFAMNLAAGGEEPYSLHMEFAELDAVTLETRAGAPPLVPEDGRILAFGRLDHEGFYINDISELTVEGPHGKRPQLKIDSSSLIKEFGSIVSLRFAFELMPQETEIDGPGYRILWGDTVDAGNEKVDNMYIDPDQRALYRRFVWRMDLGGGEDADEPYSTIVVIADSTAEYHFLWYLLPMGLIFTLLTIRKVRVSNPSS